MTVDEDGQTPDGNSAINSIRAAVLSVWPEHSDFLQKSKNRLTKATRSTAESMAESIDAVYGDRLDEIARNYRDTCEVLAEEEIFFRRHDRYRATSVAEANAAMAERVGFWARYFDGLLVSQVLWANHVEGCTRLFAMIAAQNPARALEIGPGHGLVVTQLAQRCPNTIFEAWDISADAIAATKAIAKASRVTERLSIRMRNVMCAEPDSGELFDAIILFEVLEHLDDAPAALRRVLGHLAPEGRIYVSIPINSPAPDHVGLYRNPKEVEEIATAADLVIEEKSLYPQTGYSLCRANRIGATVSYIGCWRRA